MKKDNLVELVKRIGILIGVGFLLLIPTYIMIIYLTLAVGSKFYIRLTIILAVALFVFIALHLLPIVKKKIIRIVFSMFLMVCLGFIAVHEYEQRLETVNDAVNLRTYEPFRVGSKAASLDEPSTFKLMDNLPRLDGATALYPLYAAFVQAVYPEKEYSAYNSEVICSTTSEAYHNLITGKADIIFAAAPSKEQTEAAKQAGVDLRLTPIGREAFVFFVHQRNPIQGLTIEQIQGVYAGEITDWGQLGGSKNRIRAFQRPEGSGSQSALIRLMKGKELMSPPKEDVAGGMGEIISQTAHYRNYKNALGYSFLFYATQMVREGNIRLLEINGVPPTRTTIRDGTYPISAEFYAVTAGSSNPHLEGFIQWIQSTQGQALVEKTGYTPL